MRNHGFIINGKAFSTYKSPPTCVFASEIPATVSYVVNRFGSRFLALPEPKVIFQFSAVAYLSLQILQAFQEELALCSGRESNYQPEEMDRVQKFTAFLLGAYVINLKFNPESTFLSFIKLSLSAVLTYLVTEKLKNIIQDQIKLSFYSAAFNALKEIYYELPKTFIVTAGVFTLCRSMSRLQLDAKTAATFTAVASALLNGIDGFFLKENNKDVDKSMAALVTAHIGLSYLAKWALDLDLPFYKQFGKAYGIALGMNIAVHWGASKFPTSNQSNIGRLLRSF